MVIRAKILGYCMGVRRAVDAATNAKKKYPDNDVYTLGPLIHNKTAIQMLKNNGIEILDNKFMPVLENSKKESVVVIRAHGTSNAIKKQIQDAGSIIVDATCPRVLANQKRITDYSKKGYTVFIAGDKSHGEVEALEGSVFGNVECYVLQNQDEATALMQSQDFLGIDSILISQTTITNAEYNAVKSVLEKAIPNITVFDTICPATLERQVSLRDLCTTVDGIIVIGGKNSANTNRLYQIAKEEIANSGVSKPVVHIETASEIPEEFYKLKKIGLTAGASTPDEVIVAVENALHPGGCCE